MFPSLPMRTFFRRQVCVLVACLACLPGALADNTLPVGPPVKSITVLALDDFPPLLFRDASGELQGSVREIWALWEARTGIKVNLVAADWPTIYQDMLAGKADVIDMARATGDRKPFLDFSAPHTTLNMMLYFHESISAIVDAKTSKGFLIGVIEAGGCADRLREAGSDNFKQYLTIEDLVTAAARDEIRVFCAYEPQANYFLNRLGKAREFRHSPPLYSGEGSWAVRKGDQVMYKLVADGFASISPAEREEITMKWMGAYVVGPEAPIYVRYAGYGLLTLLGLGLFLLAWNRMLQKRVDAKTETLNQTLDSLKQAQQATVAVNESLEELVASRTFELTMRIGELQAIFDAATAGIVMTRNRRILNCNRMLEQMFGYGPGELVGQSTRIWYPDEAIFLQVGEAIAAGMQQQGFYRHDHELVRKDGSRFWCRLMVRSLDPADFSKGTVGIIEDITDEREVMAGMARARELAEEAARTKADFLANMGHEIRTPMNAVIGMTHLVLKTGLTQQQRESLRKIQLASQHLLGILNDILDFSKIDAGKMTVEHIDFELERVLDNVSGLIAEKAAGKGLELIIDIAPDVPDKLVGDPLRIGQILINYANNAVKFTEHGEIAIHVRVMSELDDELVLHFSVRDTGIGIDKEQSRQLFQSFQQADSSTTRKFGGTGLGLAISKRLAELMNGETGVDSTPGAGSTFWFTARVGRGHDLCRHYQPRPGLRGRRMLVVDDNDSAREVVCEMLHSMAFDVAAVESGMAALEELQLAAASGMPYEIVFLDWQMPGMDGVATAREIRKLALPQPPLVLMVTAYGRDELIAAAEKAGIDDILLKPMTPSLLYDTVLRILGDQADEPQRVQADDLGSLPDVSAIAGARALLVEDNDLNQEVAIAFLEEAGLEVDLAPDGAAALERVQKQAYDIVMMDMQMPVMDGLTATREIRKLPGMADLPIVAMTANALNGDRERCLEAGMNDHIAKPIDYEELVARLLQWVRPRGPSSDKS